MTIDVSLRLRLVNDLSKEAKRAEGDTEKLTGSLKKLGNVRGAEKLGREVQQVGRQANSSDRQVRELDRSARKLGTVKADRAAKEIRAIGAASTEALKKIGQLRREMDGLGKVDAGKFSRINRPASELSSTMGFLKTNVGAAFGGLMAFASVDSIISGVTRLGEQFRRLNRDVASVAVTAEMRTPEAIEKIGKSNERLSVRYGVDQTGVNAARKAYAAAGFGLDQQEAILDPTLKAAKAGDATGETMSQAVIAVQQNLGVKNEEVPAALDMMAKGSKLGSFEVNAMAARFPALATLYAGTGRQGLGATAELVALAQIVRMGAGSQDQAATNLENILGKVSSPDTVKNFEEKGVSLPKLREKAEKDGVPYLTALMDEVQRLTKGDTFKVGELFGDAQAKAALAPLLNNREKYNEFLRQILGESKGTVDADYDFLSSTPQEKADRRGSAMQATGDQVGKLYDQVIGPILDRAVSVVNPDFARQEAARAEAARLKSLDLEDLRAQIRERERQLGGMPQPKFSDIDPLSAARVTIQQEIQRLRTELQAGEHAQGAGAGGDLGKSRGKDFIPIPERRPIEQQLGGDLSGAAKQAMDGYNQKLNAAGDEAVAIAREKAAQMRDALNFTATPTIQPSFLPPAGSSGPSGKQSSLPTTSATKVTQYISSPNARQAAMRAQREQNRAVRQASARTFGGTGTRSA
ncbi:MULTISPECIES: phage tail tape measure protein [unclassified Ensifer]|uniref:phage tail tape measure protein n=1 Tax=unclassified Ensifer TaxID=2633371 RepID=UPI000812C66A|nr:MULTISPECIES: phage tail tape measure protein [unclassified Ensifer]OCP17425.1 phage tail tape measure protein [Ensifer sp. LC54]OCP28669.1 phage tail tape measure protein [Ensifer sp. LC384]